MRKGVKLGLIGVLFILMLATSFVSADDVEYECDLEHECDNGFACVANNCYDIIDLGKCQPKVDMVEESYCENLGRNCFQNGYPLCDWQNYGLYTIMRYWNGEGGLGGPLGNDLVISLDKKNISNPENLEIPLEMIYRNPFLREGTQLFFEVYWRYTRIKYSGEFTPEQPTYTIGAITLSGTRIKGEETFTGVVDEEGRASTNLILKGNDLDDFDYSLEPVFTFEVLYENRSRPTGASGYQENRLFLTKKIGECSGTISCGAFSNMFECQEVAEENGADCIWDNTTNSCTGQEGVSCNNIGDKDTCNLYECSWRADSIWGRFIDFFRNLF